MKVDSAQLTSVYPPHLYIFFFFLYFTFNIFMSFHILLLLYLNLLVDINRFLLLYFSSYHYHLILPQFLFFKYCITYNIKTTRYIFSILYFCHTGHKALSPGPPCLPFYSYMFPCIWGLGPFASGLIGAGGAVSCFFTYFFNESLHAASSYEPIHSVQLKWMT